MQPRPPSERRVTRRRPRRLSRRHPAELFRAGPDGWRCRRQALLEADQREACEAFFLSLAETDVRAGKRQIPGFEVREDRRAV